jgi:hypothetical protein
MDVSGFILSLVSIRLFVKCFNKIEFINILHVSSILWLLYEFSRTNSFSKSFIIFCVFCPIAIAFHDSKLPSIEVLYIW